MSNLAKKPQSNLSSQMLVGIIGFILSFVLHELFHILMHLNHIRHISLFPNATTVAQIDVVMPAGYDIDGEEIAAYGITLLVMIITIAIIFKMRDSGDKRSSAQILFPRDSNMQKMDPVEMLKLSGFGDTIQPTRKPARKTSTKK